MPAPEMGGEEMGKNRKDFLGRSCLIWVLKYVEKIIESMVEGWPVPASDMAQALRNMGQRDTNSTEWPSGKYSVRTVEGWGRSWHG